MMLLKVNGICKKFTQLPFRSRLLRWFGFRVHEDQQNWILKDISFELGKGESLGIVGKNGAGKSTLLKIITGTLSQSSGSVIRNGRISSILELGMGFNPELTGRQNCYHTASLMGFSQEQIGNVIGWIEDFAEIEDYFEKPVRTYSSGMQARIAFAVATAFRPEILIVDEVLSVGDAYFQAKCYDRIREFKEKGTSLILVTHSVGDIVKHCSRALFIDNGTLVVDGVPRDVTNNYLDVLYSRKKSFEENIEESKGDIERKEEDFYSSDADRFTLRPLYRKEEYRWGEGGASILDYYIKCNNQTYPQNITSGDDVVFAFKVRFDEAFEDVVPGFLIKSIDGVFLYGTNSSIAKENHESISVADGDIFIFSFKMPLTLNEGAYLISFGVSSGHADGELTPLDRRYDSCIIKVSKKFVFWGLVDLRAQYALSALHFDGNSV